MRLAVTGGTGFVGGHVMRVARERGHEVQALARRPQAEIDGVKWVVGTLELGEILANLTHNTDAVIHIAGVVNVPDRAAFAAGNIAGTAAMLAAAKDAGIARFVHVSSLAAREPGLSAYGWSKAEAEALVAASGLDAAMVRPPAIYGPGDREMLELFRMATRGFVALPPGGRMSVIHAGDLARLLVTLAETSQTATLMEPDDGMARGWDHRDFARALGRAVGRRVQPLSMPAGVLRLASRIEKLARGGRAKLTADRVRYFCHPDWVVRARPDPALWRPEVETEAGLRETATWYRAKGWL